MTLRKATVPRDAGPQKLDQFLKSAFPGVSLEYARRLLSDGRVRIRGKLPKPMRKLWGGEEVEVDFPAAAAAPRVQGTHLKALFESPEFLVLDKPAGLVVEPEGRAPCIVTLAASQFRGFDVLGAAVPGVAHRLDRETSGCLALAKTDAALANLQAAFVEKRVNKRYLALVLGIPPETSSLEGPYSRDPENPRKFTTRFASARRASLTFQVRERLSDCTLVEVKLETGRTHQIRVQLSEAGFPLLGDSVYGTEASIQHPAARALGRLALHAHSLAITFPAPASPISVNAALPSEFEEALHLLRGKPHIGLE